MSRVTAIEVCERHPGMTLLAFDRHIRPHVEGRTKIIRGVPTETFNADAVERIVTKIERGERP